MPGVLMLESLSQVAAILLLAARGRAAQRARLPARRQRREVPPAGRARRSAAARDLARPRRDVAGAGAGGGVSSAIRSSPRPSCCSASCPTRPRSIRRRSSHPSARDRRRARRSARTRSIGAARDASARTAGSARRRSSTAGPRSATTREIYPFASIGLTPQDLKFQGEETRLVDRPAQHLPRVRHDPPRHARRRRRDDDRRPQRVHGLRARRARLPRRQRHHLRQHGDARRPRHGRGLREHQRRVRRPPVLPGRPARVHRRLLGGDQGRAAVRADRRQPAGAHLRRQHHRPDAARLSAGRRSTKLKRVVPLPAAVEAEHDAARSSRSSRTGRWRVAEVQYLVDFIRTSQRGVILRRATRRAEEVWPTNAWLMEHGMQSHRRKPCMRLGLIAGNGRFPFLVLDAARGAGHDVTVIALKEETFPELADAAGAAAGRRRSTGSRSASSASASAC